MKGGVALYQFPSWFWTKSQFPNWCLFVRKCTQSVKCTKWYRLETRSYSEERQQIIDLKNKNSKRRWWLTDWKLELVVQRWEVSYHHHHHHHYHDLSGINWLEEQHPLTDFKPPVEIIEFVHSFATLHGFYTFCSADSVLMAAWACWC